MEILSINLITSYFCYAVIESCFSLNITPGLLWVLAAETSAGVTIPPPVPIPEKIRKWNDTQVKYDKQNPKLEIPR